MSHSAWRLMARTTSSRPGEHVEKAFITEAEARAFSQRASDFPPGTRFRLMSPDGRLVEEWISALWN